NMLSDSFGWPRSPVDSTQPSAQNCPRGGVSHPPHSLHQTKQARERGERRHTRMSHPDINQGIARAKAQRLSNVSLGLFGAPYKNFTKSDNPVGRGKISIELQRVFELSDAPRL